MRATIRWGVLVLIPVWADCPGAQEPGEHKSAYTRVMFGGGYASLGEDVGGTANTIHGGGFAFDSSRGGFVLPDFALGVDLSFLAVPKPMLAQNGVDVGVAAAVIELIGLG